MQRRKNTKITLVSISQDPYQYTACMNQNPTFNREKLQFKTCNWEGNKGYIVIFEYSNCLIIKDYLVHATIKSSAPESNVGAGSEVQFKL